MVVRMVYFYEIRPTRRLKDAGWRLDVHGLFAHLASLIDEGRILHISTDHGTRYEFVEAHAAPEYPMIVYARCRDQALPLLARGTSLEPLEIAVDRSLAELTHAVFFPNNIIGAEYNHYGPRVSGLAEYFRHRATEYLPAHGGVHLARLVGAEALSILEGAKQIRALTVRIAPQALGSWEAQRYFSSREALQEIASGYGAQDFELTWGSRDGLSRDKVLGLVRWAVGGGHGSVSKGVARVRLQDDTIAPVNLLKSYLGLPREMRTTSPTSRSIADDSAHREIIASYHEIEHRLRDATAMYTPDEL